MPYFNDGTGLERKGLTLVALHTHERSMRTVVGVRGPEGAMAPASLDGLLLHLAALTPCATEVEAAAALSEASGGLATLLLLGGSAVAATPRAATPSKAAKVPVAPPAPAPAPAPASTSTSNATTSASSDPAAAAAALAGVHEVAEDPATHHKVVALLRGSGAAFELSEHVAVSTPTSEGGGVELSDRDPLIGGGTPLIGGGHDPRSSPLNLSHLTSYHLITSNLTRALALTLALALALTLSPPYQVRTSEEAAAVRGATLASGAKAMLLAVKGGAAFASGEAAWSQGGVLAAVPWLGTTASSVCIRRLEAGLPTRVERPDPSERPWPSRQRPPKLPTSPRLTVKQARRWCSP